MENDQQNIAPEGWAHEENELKKQFVFANFSEAFAFMVRVAFEAEKMNHHPAWKNTWNVVHIALNTHDAGNVVTEKDYKLARKINSIV